MKIKQNKGITMVDLVIALAIISIMVGVVGNLFYQSFYYSTSITRTAYATSYAINAIEWIEKMPYEEVDSSLNEKVKQALNIPADSYQIDITVENYKDKNPLKEDIIKIIKVTVKYIFNEKEESFSLKKLKIKEM